MCVTNKALIKLANEKGFSALASAVREKMRYILVVVALCSTVGCGFLPSVKYKLDIRPIERVSCYETGKAFKPCDPLASPKDAHRYFVVVGWLRYRELIESRFGKNPTREQELEAFSDYAVKQVLSLGYCSKATVPKQYSRIAAWEGSGDRGINVQCVDEYAL